LNPAILRRFHHIHGLLLALLAFACTQRMAELYGLLQTRNAEIRAGMAASRVDAPRARLPELMRQLPQRSSSWPSLLEMKGAWMLQ
jgi:hypothetical protein